VASDALAGAADEALADAAGEPSLGAAAADDAKLVDATTVPGFCGAPPREIRKIPTMTSTPRASAPHPISLVLVVVFRRAT
jgi:hypothetical protein